MSTRLFLRLCVHRDSDGLLFLFVYHKRAYCISHCLVGEVLALEAKTLDGVIFTCGYGQGAEEIGSVKAYHVAVIERIHEMVQSDENLMKKYRKIASV